MKQKPFSTLSITRVAAILAFAVAGALCLHSWLTQQSAAIIIGCDGGACLSLHQTKWAKFLGFPVLALASISYLSAITSLLLINRHAYFKSALLFLSFIIPLTAAWFIILQALILKSFCSQCCVIHGIAVLASLLSLLYISRTSVPEPRKHSLLTNRTFIFSLSAIALTTFVYLQASSPETKQYKQSAVALQINTNNNKIDLYAGKITLSKSELPYLGTHSPDTESPFSIILTDYTCPHCVTYLKELNSKAQVGSPTLYYLPAYHNANARELHRVMLTVWKMDKQVYAQLLDEILENTISLNHRAVTQRADKLLGGSLTLYMKSSMEWTHTLLEKGKKLQDLNLQLASAGALPQTIIAGELYEGSLPYDTLLKKIQQATYTQQNNGSSDPQHNMSGEIKRPSSDAPLVAERTKVDLGRVTKGQKKPGVFTIRNTSDKPIIVKKIDTSCGCIITDKSPRTVEPGEIWEVKFQFDTVKFLGPVSHNIVIHTDPKTNPVVLVARVNVWLPVKIYPTRLKFGNIMIGGENIKLNIPIITATNEDIALDILRKPKNPMLSSALKIVKIGKHHELQITITKMPETDINDEIILSTSHPDCPEIKLPITARAAAPFNYPPSIKKQSTQPGSTTQLYILCNDPSFKSGFNIKSIKYSGIQNVSIKLRPKKKNMPNLAKIYVTLPNDFNFDDAIQNQSAVIIDTDTPHGKIKIPFTQ